MLKLKLFENFQISIWVFEILSEEKITKKFLIECNHQKYENMYRKCDFESKGILKHKKHWKNSIVEKF